MASMVAHQIISQNKFPQDVEMDGKIIGVRSGIGDDWKGSIYYRLKSEGLLAQFFHNQPDIGLIDFLKWHCDPKLIYLGCFINPQHPTLDTANDMAELVGGVYINRQQSFGDESIAEVSEFFFRGVPMRFTEWFCRAGIAYIFDCLGMAAIYGVTPAKNRAACIMNRKLGFEMFGPMPKLVGWAGKASDAYITCLSRERWVSLREESGVD